MLLLCTYFKSSSRRTPTKTLNSSSSSFLFLFQTKGHSSGFEIRKKNLGYRNPKLSLFVSVVVVVVKKCLRDLSLHFEKKRQRANTPPVPFASSNPTAETLVVRRDSSNSFPLLLLLLFFVPPGGRRLWWWSFSKSSSSVSKFLCVGSD